MNKRKEVSLCTEGDHARAPAQVPQDGMADERLLAGGKLMGEQLGDRTVVDINLGWRLGLCLNAWQGAQRVARIGKWKTEKEKRKSRPVIPWSNLGTDKTRPCWARLNSIYSAIISFSFFLLRIVVSLLFIRVTHLVFVA